MTIWFYYVLVLLCVRLSTASSYSCDVFHSQIFSTCLYAVHIYGIQSLPVMLFRVNAADLNLIKSIHYKMSIIDIWNIQPKRG